MRTQPGLWGRGIYTPRTKDPTAPGSQFWGVDSSPSSPFSVAQGSLPPLPRRAGKLCPNPGAGVWGGGRERRRGRLLQARHKETSFSLGSMATLGRGRCTPNTSFPTCRARDLGGHSPAAPHLGPAYLGWGRGDAAAGGLGAVSVFVVSPARGAQGATTMGWDEKGAARGSVAPVLELRGGGPRGLLLVRDSSCCPRVPRFGVSVSRNRGGGEV